MGPGAQTTARDSGRPNRTFLEQRLFARTAKNHDHDGGVGEKLPRQFAVTRRGPELRAATRGREKRNQLSGRAAVGREARFGEPRGGARIRIRKGWQRKTGLLDGSETDRPEKREVLLDDMRGLGRRRDLMGREQRGKRMPRVLPIEPDPDRRARGPYDRGRLVGPALHVDRNINRIRPQPSKELSKLAHRAAQAGRARQLPAPPPQRDRDHLVDDRIALKEDLLPLFSEPDDFRGGIAIPDGGGNRQRVDDVAEGGEPDDPDAPA